MQLVPNSWGSLREYNLCHSPEDGRFCGRGDHPTVPALDEGARRESEGRWRVRLWDLSGFSTAPRSGWKETMVAVGQDGEPVGGPLTGGIDFVVVPEVTVQQWLEYSGSIHLMHTHPSNGAFSIDDFRMANHLSALAAGRGQALKVPVIEVVGSDGTSHRLRIKRVVNRPSSDWEELEYWYEHERAAANERASLVTDQWVTREVAGKYAGKPRDRQDLLRAAKATGVDYETAHRRHWKAESPRIWEALSQRFPETFEYYYQLAPD